MLRGAARRGVRRRLSPTALLRRKAFYGSLGGNRRWLVVGGLLWGGGRLRRAVSRQPESMLLPKLRPGQSATVTVVRPATRRERRAARRGR